MLHQLRHTMALLVMHGYENDVLRYIDTYNCIETIPMINVLNY